MIGVVFPNATLRRFDPELWALRLASGQIAAVRTDWDRAASGAPGHDLRRHLARARDTVAEARARIDRDGAPGDGWRERLEEELRAARRIIVRQQIARYGRWWPSERRYLD
ncbi:MAG: hypothetical protein FJ033_00735 [Chloroflexi bacterium]|nr:hypothetical protein [Chloroflexota bacterium]